MVWAAARARLAGMAGDIGDIAAIAGAQGWGNTARATGVWAGRQAFRHPLATGAALGAGWGMMSSDTSMAGGALGGAALGAGVFIGRGAIMGGMRAFGAGASAGDIMKASAKRSWVSASLLGRSSAGRIGATSRRAYGFIRGLPGR